MKLAPRLAFLASLAALAGSRLLANPINPVVEYTSDSPFNDSRSFTLGFEFAFSTTYTVDALGYWTEGGNVAGQQVGLWTSGGTLLASTTIQAGDPVVGHFQWDDITPVVLGPGDYVIGGTFENNIFAGNANGVTSIAGYTYITDEQAFGSGLNFPAVSTGGSYGTNGMMQADLSVVSTGSVPDAASTIALLGGGLALLGAARRRLRR